MSSSDFKKIAREKLAGNWGKAAIICLVYFLFFFALGIVMGILHIPDSLDDVISIVIEIPIIYGLIMVLFKLFNSEVSGATDMFTYAFNNFSRAWSIYLRILLKLLIPIILIIVSVFIFVFGIALTVSSYADSALSELNLSSSGIAGFGAIILIIGGLALLASSIWYTIKSFYYSLAFFIGVENPDLPAKDVVERSEQLMQGNKWKFFCLQLSFIGWSILCTFTFGIGALWLFPYLMFSHFAFYKNLSENSSSNNPVATSASVSTNVNNTNTIINNVEPIKTVEQSKNPDPINNSDPISKPDSVNNTEPVNTDFLGDAFAKDNTNIDPENSRNKLDDF